MGYNLLLKNNAFSVTYSNCPMLLLLTKNVVHWDKSYFVEFSEKVSFVTECILMGYAMKDRGVKQNNNISYSYLVHCFLRDKKMNLKKI